MILKKAFKGIKLPAPQRFYHSSKKYFDKPVSTESQLHENENLYETQMYENWLKDRTSVHVSWDNYFTNLRNGISSGLTAAKPQKTGDQSFQAHEVTAEDIAVSEAIGVAKEALRVREMILSYINRGHERADLDPLSKAQN